MTEKTLEAYNDVFADIVNVLLFNGEQLVREEDLSNATSRSIYKTDKNFTNRSGTWRNTGVK